MVMKYIGLHLPEIQKSQRDCDWFTGDLVKKMQKALQTKSFYEGNIDGDFGERTLRAVMKFQTSSFGPNADDGIVGPQTAAVLKISWPDV